VRIRRNVDDSWVEEELGPVAERQEYVVPRGGSVPFILLARRGVYIRTDVQGKLDILPGIDLNRDQGRLQMLSLVQSVLFSCQALCGEVSTARM